MMPWCEEGKWVWGWKKEVTGEREEKTSQQKGDKVNKTTFRQSDCFIVIYTMLHRLLPLAPHDITDDMVRVEERLSKLLIFAICDLIIILYIRKSMPLIHNTNRLYIKFIQCWFGAMIIKGSDHRLHYKLVSTQKILLSVTKPIWVGFWSVTWPRCDNKGILIVLKRVARSFSCDYFIYVDPCPKSDSNKQHYIIRLPLVLRRDWSKIYKK